MMLTAKQALCLLASCLVSIVLCLGDQSICFSDFDNRNPSIGVNRLRAKKGPAPPF